MNDFSPAFNPPEFHPNARFDPHADPRPRRRFIPAMAPRPAVRAAPCLPGARPGPAAMQAQDGARGALACRMAWQRVLLLGADGVLALPRALLAWGGASAAADGDALDAIAIDVEHTLTHGTGPGSARALVLLAAVASSRFDGGEAADAIAGAALTLPTEPDEADAVRVLHAALMLAQRQSFAACVEAAGPAPGDAQAATAWSVLRFGAGVPIPDILHGLEPAGAPPASAQWLAMLRVLAVPQPDGASLPAMETASFDAWTWRLQLAWLTGHQAEASRAALVAASLAGPLAAPASLMLYHLFATLALAWDAAPQHRHAMRWHHAELDLAAARCFDNAGAMAALAGAVVLASAGDVPGALRGYESAATLAVTHGQGWVAALAWELAASLCQQSGFDAALPAYRRRALMAWHGCGAHGRVGRLCQGWNGGAPAQGWPCGEQHGAEIESRRVARASTVGEMGVSIAHEVNQPLAAILLQAAAARRWLRRPRPDIDKALDALEQIAVSGRRAGDIVRSVQGLARRHATDLSVFPVDAALDEAVRLLARPLRKHGVQAALALALDGCQIHANRAQVQQVVINLMLNAIDALATIEDRPRQIVLASRRLGPATIEISVADNGPGVAPADRERIFSALFSTKENGTGVGLSICRAIAEAHGGHIEYRPQQPHGALFSLVLAVGTGSVG